jgi:DNA-binding response OmpR family regulator
LAAQAVYMNFIQSPFINISSYIPFCVSISYIMVLALTQSLNPTSTKGLFMFRVLLVEDTTTTYELVKAALENDVDLDWAKTISEARSILAKNSYDLILLDVMLPDGDGFQLCSVLQMDKNSRNVPVFYLTARDSIDDRVFGFSTGAEDYIVKPFDIRELQARVLTKLRKQKANRSEQTVVRYGDIEANFSNQNVIIIEGGNKTKTELTAIEFRLLSMFIQKPEHLFNREEILDRIWGQDVHVFPRNVDTHISKLRKKLGHCGRYITSVRSSGYQMRLPAKPQRYFFDQPTQNNEILPSPSQQTLYAGTQN